MSNKLKSVVVMLVGLCLLSFANATEAPSYNEVLAQQLKCNTLYFSKAPWDKKLQLLERMDNSTVVVISKPIVTELPPKVYQNVHPDYKNRKERNFKVSATSFDFFTCGPKKPFDPSKDKGIPVEAFIDISETKAGSGTFNISEGKPTEGGSFLYSTSDEGGMYCIVLMDNFLKSPNAINVNKLCEGKSAKDREATKMAIEQARKGWKDAGIVKSK